MSTKHKPTYKRIAQLKTADEFKRYIAEIGALLPFDEEMDRTHSPFDDPYMLSSGKTIGNRFCILPMEGWDGTPDGKPSEHTTRRWHNFAISGAKLLWGCEAVAVTHEGRANPNQLLMNEENFPEFERLFNMVMEDHRQSFGTTDALVVGLQLTHSGRFCKPNDKKKLDPRILYPHPILNKKFGLGMDYPTMTDEAIDQLIDDFIKAALLAEKAGFHFVDIKHCHGYLGHEFLSAVDRKGRYGGNFENRTRFLRSVVEGIKAVAPNLEIGVRLSAVDFIPFRKDEDEVGTAETFENGYPYAFGGATNGTSPDYTETFQFVKLLDDLNIQLVCVTIGSPYYNPHIQRPALFPPSDGYLPPEDPLVGVARQIEVVAEIKKAFPDMAIVGSAYSYLQEWLPNVAQAVLKQEMADFIGLGRMVLSYPEMPRDILEGNELKRGKLCRTFSDCTTAPRNGMISGCFPLDPYYKQMEEAGMLKEIKKEL